MTAVPVRQTGSVPRHALRRGTRGFAAVVLLLTAAVVLAIAGFVLPSSDLGRLALSWLIPLAIAFGIAHLVAMVGLLRRRPWAASLTLYLAAIGIGVAAFGLLLARAGVELFGGSPAGVAGLLVWLIGSWLVAARYAVRGMAASERRAADPVPASVEADVEAQHRHHVLRLGAAVR
jgi:hypothetical protein